MKNSNKLIDLNTIFRDIYSEKVLKLNNIININMNEGEEINNNMNFKSYISGQKWEIK